MKMEGAGYRRHFMLVKAVLRGAALILIRVAAAPLWKVFFFFWTL